MDVYTKFQNHKKRYLASFIASIPFFVFLTIFILIKISSINPSKVIELKKPQDIVINIKLDTIIEQIQQNTEKQQPSQQSTEKPAPTKKPPEPKKLVRNKYIKRREVQPIRKNQQQHEQPQQDQPAQPPKPKIHQQRIMKDDDFSQTQYDASNIKLEREKTFQKETTNFQSTNQYNTSADVKRAENFKQDSTQFQKATSYNTSADVKRAENFKQESTQFQKATSYNTSADVKRAENFKQDSTNFQSTNKYNTAADVKARQENFQQENTNFQKATSYDTSADVKARSVKQFTAAAENFNKAMYKFTDIKERIKQQYSVSGEGVFKGDYKNYNIDLKSRGGGGGEFVDNGVVKGGQVDYSAEIAQMRQQIAGEKRQREALRNQQNAAILDAIFQKQELFRAQNKVQKPLRAREFENNPAPIYPIEAEIMGLSGTSTFEVEVLKNGSIGSVRLVKSSGHQSLDEEAKYTIQNNWSFYPATDQFGKPYDDTIKVDISFLLN